MSKTQTAGEFSVFISRRICLKLKNSLIATQRYVYFHLKKQQRRAVVQPILRCLHKNNPNVWNAVYRICTERILIKGLREWDNTAWWIILDDR